MRKGDIRQWHEIKLKTYAKFSAMLESIVDTTSRVAEIGVNADLDEVYLDAVNESASVAAEVVRQVELIGSPRLVETARQSLPDLLRSPVIFRLA